MSTLVWIIGILIVIAIGVVVIAWLYERATNEVSLVKTGIGGRKVIIDGGTIAIPYFHDISRVNMQTQRFDVERKGDNSLITKDRMRVDVGAQFYASVMPTPEAIARAAQTLGKRSFQPDQLHALIDGMLIDALHSVAAGMSMDELHESRAKFVSAVRDNLKDKLLAYGLQIESVSLTELDQTQYATLDENNVFNAVGMRKLAEVIAKSKKERAEIDADAEISVRNTEVEASRRRLDIDLEERRAEIAQQQEIETISAAQIAEIAKRKAQSELSAAQARIEMEKGIQTAEIERQRSLEITEQDRNILVAAKSEEGSRAEIQADAARIEAVKAAEAVITARETAEAERRKDISLIASRAQAEASAVRSAIAAESDKATAKDIAMALREQAEAQKAVKIAKAEANRVRIDVENSRSEPLIAMELEKARLEAMPKILSEMVKPAEKIKGINIHHISGNAFDRSGGSGEKGSEKPVVSQILDSIMEMSVQLPILKKIGDSVGMNFDDGSQDKDNQGKDNQGKDNQGKDRD